MSFIEIEETSLPTLDLDVRQEGARVLLVLDYPSGDDVRQGKACAGAYGTILASCLASAGIALSTCSIIFIFPFPNENYCVNKFFTEKTGLTSEGLEFLNPLRERILDLDPTVIVPIGEMALQLITGKRGIEKYRGSILESSLVLGLKAIPTVHPRDSFKRFLLRYHIASDCKKIARESLRREIVLPVRTLLINPLFSEVISYLKDIKENKKEIAIDIECPVPKPVKDKTTGVTKIYGTKGVTCISFATAPDYCMSIPFNNYVWTETQEIEIWDIISYILFSEEIRKKYQNGACFDIIYQFMVHSLITRGAISDTLIKTNILYPEFPKSLAFLTSTRTDEPYYKDDGKEVNVDGTRDWNQYYIYNAKDSAVDFEIDIDLDKELEKSGNLPMWEYSQRLIEPLFYLQVRGIKINEKKLKEHKEEAKVYLKSLQEKLNTLVGEPINVSSPKQIMEFFYTKKNYPSITKSIKDKDGNRKEVVTVDNKAMTKIARLYDSEEARLEKKIRGCSKLIGTYLELPFDEDSRMRGAFKQSTKFGRLASSKTPFKTGMNQQNLPKVFMEFLEADDGFMCFELDKAQAEWVDSAYYFNEPNMIRAVEAGEDVHVSTAMLMFGAPKELIERENEILGPLTEPTEIEALRREKCPEVFLYPILPNMSMRQAGKKCNHSFNYGLSSTGFSMNYDMPTAQGKICYDLYHKKAYPGILKAHERIRNQIVLNRTLINGFGWKRRFLGRLDDNTFRQAYSYHGQSTVGRLLNEGIISIYYQQFDPDLAPFMRPVDLFSQVHDSVKGQYPDTELRNFAKALKQMQLDLDIPLKANGRTYVIKTDAKVGYNLKKMETVPLYGTEEEIYLKLLEIKKKLKPLKETKPEIENAIQEALEQEEEDLLLEKLQKEESENYAS